MTRLAILLTIVTAMFAANAADAEDCRNGVCRLRPAVNSRAFQTRMSDHRSQSTDWIGSACADGRCGVAHDGRPCDCNDPSCNCTPIGYGADRLDNERQRAGNRGDYRYTNFEAPALRRNTSYGGPARRINWESDFRRGLQAARESGRPMLVRVTADWCGYCKRMKQETFSNAGIVRDIDSSFVAISVDADANRQLVEQMGVQSLPCTLVISPDMRIVDREQGFRSVNQLENVLRRHLQRAQLETETLVAVR